MKILVVIAILYVTCVQTTKLRDDQKILDEDGFKACGEKFNIDEDVQMKIRLGDDSFVDENSKCFIHCYMCKANLFTESGELDTEFSIKQLTPQLTEKELEKTTKNVHKCKVEKGANECDKAYAIFKCYFNEKKSY